MKGLHILIMPEIIIIYFDPQHESEIRGIRNAVFTQEQKVPEDIDFDGTDSNAIHVLVKEGDRFVGTGRMLHDGHIGRLAVLKEHRGKGFGTTAVRALVDEARRVGLKRVFLGAQMYAVGFYQKLGFTEYGAPFMEANMEHIHMERILIE
jgi:predicted GNAT family N-acyltransferase